MGVNPLDDELSYAPLMKRRSAQDDGSSLSTSLDGLGDLSSPLTSVSAPKPTAPASPPAAGGDLLEPSYAGAVAPAQAPAAPRTSSPDVDRLASSLDQLNQTADPRQQAVLRDQVSRGAAATLKAAGHDVKWNGEDLIVDGRPYELATDAGAGATTAARPTDDGESPGETPPPSNQDMWGRSPGDPSYGDPFMRDGSGNIIGYNGQYYPNQGPNAPPPGDPTQTADPTAPAPPTSASTPAGASPMSGLRAFAQSVRGSGADVANQINDRFGLHPGEDGAALYYKSNNTIGLKDFYLVGQPDGSWKVVDRPAGGDHGGLSSSLSSLFDGLTPFEPSPLSAHAPASVPSWSPTAHPYTPGNITFDDIPNFSFDELVAQLNQHSPLDDATSAAAQALLAHPTSFDDHYVDTLKAKSKDELADMQTQQDADLTNFSFAHGLADSPFVESERLAGKASRDRALVDSNRNIDLTSAAARKGDERAALELAGTLSNQQATIRQQGISTAVRATLDRATLIGNRQALRESVNQEAAKIGISADDLQLRYTVAAMQEATQRYGIDVNADIAMQQMRQRGREFTEDLAFRIKQLEQAEAQFGAQYGLDTAKFQHQIDKDSFDEYWQTTHDDGAT